MNVSDWSPPPPPRLGLAAEIRASRSPLPGERSPRRPPGPPAPRSFPRAPAPGRRRGGTSARGRRSAPHAQEMTDSSPPDAACRTLRGTASRAAPAAGRPRAARRGSRGARGAAANRRAMPRRGGSRSPRPGAAASSGELQGHSRAVRRGATAVRFKRPTRP